MTCSQLPRFLRSGKELALDGAALGVKTALACAHDFGGGFGIVLAAVGLVRDLDLGRKLLTRQGGTLSTLGVAEKIGPGPLA